MDFGEEDPDLAEAIRLSLAESQPRPPPSSAGASTSSSSTPAGPPAGPTVIDLTDDLEPVKAEPGTSKKPDDGPRMGTFEESRKDAASRPRIGAFEEPERDAVDPPRRVTFEPPSQDVVNQPWMMTFDPELDAVDRPWMNAFEDARVDPIRGPRIGTFDEPRLNATGGPRMGTFDEPRSDLFMNPTVNEPTKHNQDDNDEELNLAIALSLSEAALSHPAPTSSATKQSRSTPDASIVNQVPARAKPASTVDVFSNLDRTEMERERQERIKRKANAGTPAKSPSNAKKSRLTTSGTNSTVPVFESTSLLPSLPPSTSRSHAELSSSSAPNTTTRPLPSNAYPSLSAQTMSAQPPPPTASPPPSCQSIMPYNPEFHVATFRNTAIRGRPKSNGEIEFGDLVKKEYLQKGIFTTFVLKEEWLRKHLPSTITQCIVKHWRREDDEKPGICNDGQVLYVHPPLTGWGSFHSKLMVLFYPTFCRVVISSANLVPEDWGHLVNTLYVQDFPLLPVPATDPANLGDFGCSLYNCLTVMKIPPKVLGIVRTVDFSSAKVHLLPSVQGSHPVHAKHTYGIARLSKILHGKTSQDEEMELEYQTSSLGKVTVKFLNEFSRASRGVPPRPRLKVNMEERIPPIKAVFPTRHHVQTSRLGELGARTICFQDQYWDDHSFPKRIMHDFECAGSLEGSLMHSKFILAKATGMSLGTGRPISTPANAGNGASPKVTRCAGWLYVGSANFTESAWGMMSNKTATQTDDPGLYVSSRNWELGVVYVIETKEEMQALAEGAGGGDTESYFGPFPVPYKRPLKPYEPSDLPW
ncbi:hypothetical protein BGX31_000292, partial [Mortierella sp. GBA43]